MDIDKPQRTCPRADKSSIFTAACLALKLSPPPNLTSTRSSTHKATTPSLSHSTAQMSSSNPTYGSYNATASTDATTIDATARTVHYKCGDCDQDVPLKRGEPIRCRNCGHRVLYKQRTNRYVFFPGWRNGRGEKRGAKCDKTGRVRMTGS
jgi:DNA-directed RNA polymerase I, II, and III subunit RPABC4